MMNRFIKIIIKRCIRTLALCRGIINWKEIYNFIYA